MSDEFPTIRTEADAQAYAESIARIRGARSQTRADLAEGYLTRVQELEALNADQAAELALRGQEILSLREQLDNCTQSNLELQRQLSTLNEQLENEVRLRQQDFDRTLEP